MDYRNAQAMPSKHLAGIAVVVCVHLLLVWLVVSGVGASIIVTVVPPLVITPVMPDKPVPLDPPKLPEATLVNVILTVPQVPPPVIEIERVNLPSPIATEGVKNDPFPVVVSSDPVLRAGGGTGSVGLDKPLVVTVGVACPNADAVRENVRYPLQAQREGLSGEVEVEFTVSAAGAVSGEAILSSTNRVFNSAALLATRQFKCHGQGQDVKVKVPYSFKMPN